MPSSNHPTPVCDAYSFGSFEVRVGQEILLNRGRRVKIQDLPFQMLLVLLERPGELVSKEVLRDRLWGQETFVEVDESLYVVAAKLREALGDDASGPRFVRTVSGKGYRFIGKVTPVFDPITTATESTLPSPPTKEEQDQGLNRHPSSFAIRRLPVLFLFILIVAAVCLSIFLIYKHYDRPLVGEKNSIVVGGFANATGNPNFGSALSSVFRVKLQESPYLNLIPDLQFRRLIKDPDPASLRDQLHACAALDGQVLLKGELNSVSQGYRVLLTAWRCGDGKLLATVKADANSQSNLLSALDLATVQLRRRLGESARSVQEFNVPSMQATTGSLTALEAFSLGEEKRFQGLKPEALTAYKLAVDLDPQFALAYARLGAVYTNMGEASLSRQYYKRAFDLRDRTTDRERLYIIAHYYAFSTGEIRRAIEDYELWRTMYPRDMVPANNLAIEYMLVGQPEKSVDLARAAVQLDPHDRFPYATLAQAYWMTGDYGDLRALCDDPAHNNTDIIGFHIACFEGAFARNDGLGMQRQMEWANGNPEESRLLDEAAWVAIYRGKLSEARRLLSAAKKGALQNNYVLAAASVQLDAATMEADLGFSREAKRDALDALTLASGKASERAFAAIALARAGDIPGAQSNMKEAAAKEPSDTLLNSAVLASARAAIQLKEHNPEAAIQSLEEARPFDFCESMALAPAYYRGLAYLQDNKPQQAAKEFQRVIDHRAIAPTSLYLVLSQLELGRTFQLAGDRENAKRLFHNLKDIWKDADPDFPPLKQLHDYEHKLAVQR
jgi:DNA-binding winged helix-turn-helix (wHTH) protein/tetratricopeptide (TPR) repeat protein